MPDEATVEGAALAPRAFALRMTRGNDERLLVVNLGGPLKLTRMPEPLLAAPATKEWGMRWSSERPVYGGLGLPEFAPTMEGWSFPGGCAVMFAPTAGTMDPDGEEHA